MLDIALRQMLRSTLLQLDQRLIPLRDRLKGHLNGRRKPLQSQILVIHHQARLQVDRPACQYLANKLLRSFQALKASNMLLYWLMP